MADERHAQGLVGDRPPVPEREGGPVPGEADATLPEALDPDLASWTADYPWVFPPMDPWVEALWHERRWRRRAVRAVGALLLLGALVGLTDLCDRPPAMEAIACWATFGAITGVPGRVCPVAAPIAEP